jgi:hypothetical protein
MSLPKYIRREDVQVVQSRGAGVRVQVQVQQQVQTSAGEGCEERLLGRSADNRCCGHGGGFSVVGV